MKRELPVVLVEFGKGCDLPPTDRICFAVDCSDNMTLALAPGQHHPTRCKRDAIAPGYALSNGPRRVCALQDDCDDLHADAIRSDPEKREPRVHCPENCAGFINPGRRV